MAGATYVPLQGTAILEEPSAYVRLLKPTGATEDLPAEASGQWGGFRWMRMTDAQPANLSPEKWVGLAGRSSKTATQTDTLLLQRQLDYVRHERDELTMTVQERRADQARRIAVVVGDEVGLFILAKIADAGRVDLTELTENLTAPYGWLAFAALWRAELVDYHGGQVFVTDIGSHVAEQLGAATAVSPRRNS